MRRFMGPARLWASEESPAEDWVKPHVLWLPQHDPQVLDYFGGLRQVVARFPDVITPIADEDLHLTIQSVRQLNTDGVRVDAKQMARAAVLVQHELGGMESFDLEIGPARASGSAGIVEIWPEAGPAELNRRVRAGLEKAGMVLPPPEEHFWPHMSCGYGVEDATTAEAAMRSDKFASDIGKAIRPAIRSRATISSVWLVWQRQVPECSTYTFERVHELHLGKGNAPS
ncbi:2'-5' RNA ligase family protein [Streptomyces sp. 8L]|uniref:2'-5' RNA ligase family protein n=1 Tax=Streptomyces sp. 8L TaxID=2877242 RepID=UPI001CD4EA53|nr:2'-5' RNA ligase family protein [Streptomyces sp. 8L]MCA1220017.1 2'-5' RNA ligase family protein [Streptomyces sp. 8L]